MGTYNRDGRIHFLHVALFNQNLPGLVTEFFDLFLLDQLARAQQRDLSATLLLATKRLLTCPGLTFALDARDVEIEKIPFYKSLRNLVTRNL